MKLEGRGLFLSSYALSRYVAMKIWPKWKDYFFFKKTKFKVVITFTKQILAVFDIYRNQLRAEERWLRFMHFLCFAGYYGVAELLAWCGDGIQRESERSCFRRIAPHFGKKNRFLDIYALKMRWVAIPFDDEIPIIKEILEHDLFLI